MLLVSAVQGFCRLSVTCSIVSACAFSDHRARAKALLARPRPNISAEGLHFSAFSFCTVIIFVFDMYTCLRAIKFEHSSSLFSMTVIRARTEFLQHHCQSSLSLHHRYRVTKG